MGVARHTIAAICATFGEHTNAASQQRADLCFAGRWSNAAAKENGNLLPKQQRSVNVYMQYFWATHAIRG